MIWNLNGTIGAKVLNIINGLVEVRGEANKLNLQIQKQLLKSKSTELEAQGTFWKKHYNTPLGAGTVPKYVFKVQQTFKEEGI